MYSNLSVSHQNYKMIMRNSMNVNEAEWNVKDLDIADIEYEEDDQAANLNENQQETQGGNAEDVLKREWEQFFTGENRERTIHAIKVGQVPFEYHVSI